MDDKDEAKRRVPEDGQSVYISRIAGTGKSYYMKELVKELRDAGHNVKIVAKCHVAALNAGGVSFLSEPLRSGLASRRSDRCNGRV